MFSFARFSVLLVLLLAVFVGQPVEHCAGSCGEAYCHAVEGVAAHEDGDSALASSAGGHSHLPCIHLSEGDIDALAPTAGKKCHAAPPSLGAAALWAWPLVARAQHVGRPACPVSPLSGVWLPMLC